MVQHLPRRACRIPACILLVCFVCSNAFSQVFTNSATIPIPDNGAVGVPVTVSGLANSIDTTTFGLQSVTISLLHSENQQLVISLESPDGNLISLARDLPGSNFSATEFNGSSQLFIDFGSAPYHGGFRPLQDLARLNNGQDPNGTWTLHVSDHTAGITGSVEQVSLNFGSAPAKPLFSSSTLPIFKIYTNGQQIVDEPKIIADMYLIDNGPGVLNLVNQTTYAYQGKIGIEIRGHSSQQFPKKQFGFETREDNGEDDKDVSLLGMPKESDWILNANYTDKTMLRNPLSYELARQLGHYASRTRYCEVMINDEYRGVYVFQEKIKRDKNRVNVEKLALTDIAPPKVTGGYIFSIDKLDGGEVIWKSKIAGSKTLFQFNYPKKPEDIAPEQKTYLQNYVDSFEQALNGASYQDPELGFRKFADGPSFADFFIINELARNIDAYRISSYFHKSREGKIIAGPVWDFDIAWGNANYNNGNSPEGFVYEYNYPAGDYQVPFWWARLRSDEQWNRDLMTRYQALRTSTLSQAHLDALIDSMANELQGARDRNFARWHILGQYVWPNPAPIPADYPGEIQKLKTFIANRLAFLDTELGRALPVQMSSFTATRENDHVLLKWVTADEKNTDRFEIEKASGNGPYSIIGVVAAQNASGGASYLYRDADVMAGTIYYRLNQVDRDGKSTYSKVVTLTIRAAEWKIAPNQVSSRLMILSPAPDDQKIRINIYNFSGQKVAGEAVANQAVIYQDVSRLLAGNYVLEIVEPSGSKTVLRFVKK